MRQEVLQVICAGLGTLGFALFFHVQARHLLLATLGGALSWVLYLAVLAGGGNVFVAALVSSLVVCLWAETFARVRKAPATIFLIPRHHPPAAWRQPLLHHERPDRHRHGDSHPQGEGDWHGGHGHRSGHPRCFGDRASGSVGLFPPGKVHLPPPAPLPMREI